MNRGLVFVLVGAGTIGCGDNIGVAPCTESGSTCLFAGTGQGGYNIENPNANRLESKLYHPSDLSFDRQGRAYIADWNNHLIRRVEADQRLIDVVGADYEGDGPPEMEDRLPTCAPPGAPGTLVAMNHPTDVTVGPDGLVYISAWHNNKIRVYDPETELVVALTGNSYGYGGDGELACNAVWNQPKGVIVGPDNTVYAIDQRNVRIRAIDPTTKVVTTIAGVGSPGFSGDGASAMEAQFGFETGTTPRPSGGLALDGRTMYVADSLNNRIRKIDLDTQVIETIAGTGEAGYTGDGGAALSATFNFPTDLEIGPDGRLYFADRGNHAIRALDVRSGTVATVVGTGEKCDTFERDCAVGLPGPETQLHEPYGIAFDPDGNLYVADTHNDRVLMVRR